MSNQIFPKTKTKNKSMKNVENFNKDFPRKINQLPKEEKEKKCSTTEQNIHFVYQFQFRLQNDFFFVSKENILKR